MTGWIAQNPTEVMDNRDETDKKLLAQRYVRGSEIVKQAWMALLACNQDRPDIVAKTVSALRSLGV